MAKGYVLYNDQDLIPGVSNQLGNPVTGINLKNTGQTILYTVPAGKTLILTDVILLITAADTVAVVPIIRIGKTPNFNEWIPLTTVTGLSSVGKFTRLASSVALLISQSFAAGEVVALDVQTGATATTLTVSAYSFGYLI